MLTGEIKRSFLLQGTWDGSGTGGEAAFLHGRFGRPPFRMAHDQQEAARFARDMATSCAKVVLQK